MDMVKPSKFIRETKNYWVLAEFNSKSNPAAKAYEVRTSKNDGKTYCSCRGWIVKLNQSKVTGGPAICTHIAKFQDDKEAEPVVVYSFDEFVRVKRSLDLIADAQLSTEINIRRA